jgi:hypothetical protein
MPYVEDDLRGHFDASGWLIGDSMVPYQVV